MEICKGTIFSSTLIANLEPGPSALRWLLGDDVADRAWGRVKITSQLIGYFEGKAVLPRIYFRQWASRGGEAFAG